MASAQDVDPGNLAGNLGLDFIQLASDVNHTTHLADRNDVTYLDQGLVSLAGAVESPGDRGAHPAAVAT